MTVFVTGAGVLTIEVLGTRIIGPVFGVSLFVWSALLAVTLASLAIGYYAGGVLVDRMPTPRILGAAVAAGGVLLGLVRAYSHVVLRSAVFPKVRAFRDSPPADQPGEPGNLIFFASDGPIEFTIPGDARFENAVCESIQRSFQAWEVPKQVADGPLITDRHNPLARLQLPVAEEHFVAMNKLLPVEVWLQ